MESKLVRWNLTAGKIEALWLILFGVVVAGYIRSGELKLFLSGGWVRFTEVFGIIMIVGGVVVLLFCGDNEKDNVLYRIREGGRKELFWRLAGIGLLVLVLAVSLVVPYFTVLENPFSAEALGGEALAGVGKSEIVKSGKKEPGQRDFRDWTILFANSNDLSIYEGENADVAGLAALDNRLPDGCFFLSQDLVTHCEDCAEKVLITCRVDGKNDVPDAGAWIEARGVFRRSKIGRQNVIILYVKEYKMKEMPAENTIYP